MTSLDAAAAGGSFSLGGDLTVNRLGFGAMRLLRGSYDGPPRDPETGMAVLRRAVDLGVNHIDTAWFYRAGAAGANDLIRAALSPYPDDLVIATKVGPLLGPNGLPTMHSDAAGLRALVEQNLETLGVDQLDLVYLRVGRGLTVMPGEQFADRFEALAGLREEGLIKHLGISNVDYAQFVEACAIAPVSAVQNHFHVHRQEQDTSVLSRCEELGIAFVPFFPLGGGLDPVEQDRLDGVAHRHDATVRQIALAYLLARSPVLLPIPGTGSVDHLEENLAAAGITLSESDLAELG
jgi:aryl-alcohol dehydrogenase-like predicted oxidoreductase